MNTKRYNITTDIMETHDAGTFPFLEYSELSCALGHIRDLEENNSQAVKAAVLGYISNLHEMLGKGKLK